MAVERANSADDVSWRSIAVHLADRGAACVFVDRTFHVRLFSLGLERMVGWARDEIEGHPWIDALVPPEQQQVVLARMERAVAVSLAAGVVELVTSFVRRARCELPTRKPPLAPDGRGSIRRTS
jgi:PAS domain S-box-containing protein